MATNYEWGGGWCTGCGRRRGADGRCANCDAWWASPLVAVGGPMVLGTTALLTIGIWFLKGSEPAPPPRPVSAPALVAAAPSPGFAVASPHPLRAPRTVRVAPPPPPLPWAEFDAADTANEAVNRLPRPTGTADASSDLRRLSARAEAAVVTDDATRVLAGQGPATGAPITYIEAPPPIYQEVPPAAPEPIVPTTTPL